MDENTNVPSRVCPACKGAGKMFFNPAHSGPRLVGCLYCAGKGWRPDVEAPCLDPKLQGAFVGCPHHGDDYEACIQHSGTAPCGVEEEWDVLAAHTERLTRLVAELQPIHGELVEALSDTPVHSYAKLYARLRDKLRGGEEC